MPRGQYDRKSRIVGADVTQMTDFDGERPAESAAPKVEAAPVKKGRCSWGRKDLLKVTEKDPNFTYRFVRKDPSNIAAKIAEGWEYVTKVVNEKAIYHSTERMYDGTDLTSVRETHDSVLMRLPNDLKADRDEWLNEQNSRLQQMLERDAKKEIGSTITGGINIQGGQYKNIIE